MSKKKNEKIKIYVVTVLTLVLAALGYFRFLHKESTVVANIKPGTELPAGPDVPQVKIRDPAPDVRPYPTPEKETGRAFIRDIFAPLKPLLKKARRPTEQKSSKPAPALKLKGTIVGGGDSIAIINDQFIRKGDQIGEFSVVKIGKKEVLLRSANDQVVLKLMDNE
jgi:hypothetical protein